MRPAVPPVAQRILALAPPDLVDDTFHGALELWCAPQWRVVVVGRVSTGKSSLINALVPEANLPTGLGGVTRAATTVYTGADGHVALVDTPGIDGFERWPAALDLELEHADAVLWVVDGLQPVTDTERKVLRGCVPLGTIVHVVVSRLDLIDPDEVDDVLARVEVLTVPWAPRTVRRLDLRHATEAPAALIVAEPQSSHRRRSALRRALETLLTDLRRRTSSPDPHAIRTEFVAAWRARVRAVEALVEASIDAEEVVDRATALRRLRHHARSAREQFLEEITQDPRVETLPEVTGLPELPLPDLPGGGVVDAVLDGLAGAGSALRDMRAHAGRWMIEGEAAILDWLAPTLDDADPSKLFAVYRKLQDLVESALAIESE